MSLRKIPLHPFLFSVFPIAFLYAINMEELPVDSIFIPAAIALSLACLLFLILRLFFRDTLKSSVLLSIFLLLFFTFGHVYFTLSNMNKVLPGAWLQICLNCIWILLLVASFFLITRQRADIPRITYFLNILSLALTLIIFFNITAYNIRTRSVLLRHANEGAVDLKAADRETQKILPDIYYLILDGYAGTFALGQIYDYDNSGFIDYLKGQGFYVASESYSNYSLSFLSLASSLNMEYINDIADDLGVESKDRSIFYKMIKESKVAAFLKSKGYMFIHFGSSWRPTTSNNYADVDINYGFLDEFSIVLIRTSWLSPFLSSFMIENNRHRVLNTFEKIPQIAEIDEPTFVFAHIVIPHPPFMFDQDGKKVGSAGSWREDIWRDNRLYINQLIFVNKELRSLIENLLSRTGVPPIIILQADHGPSSTFQSWRLNELDLDENQITEKMNILNAYYLSAYDKNELYESVTPVNSFRMIFNHLFDTGYDLLEDRSYFSDYELPYKFIDVTNALKNILGGF